MKMGIGRRIGLKRRDGVFLWKNFEKKKKGKVMGRRKNLFWKKWIVRK